MEQVSLHFGIGSRHGRDTYGKTSSIAISGDQSLFVSNIAVVTLSLFVARDSSSTLGIEALISSTTTPCGFLIVVIYSPCNLHPARWPHNANSNAHGNPFWLAKTLFKSHIAGRNRHV